MAPRNPPRDPGQPPSDAEKAMSANARSRDKQGKASDHARNAHEASPAAAPKPGVGPK